MKTDKLQGKVIRFNEGIEDLECGFDPGQFARVINVAAHADGVAQLICDFSEFEEHNKKVGKANYYDKNGNPCLKWHESDFYPNTKREDVYVMDDDPTAPWPFELSEEGPISTEDMEPLFKKECHERAKLIDPDDDQDWYSLTLGWAIAKGMHPDKAHEFANHIRYETELG